MIVRFPQLLFLSAGFLLVVLLAVAGYVIFVPSPAQYWGLDPDLSPTQAAEQAFADGDYRFLGARVILEQGNEAEIVYGIFNCVDHPSGKGRPGAYTRFAELRGMDAWATADSVRDFADTYNFRIQELLEEHTDARCSGYDVG